MLKVERKLKISEGCEEITMLKDRRQHISRRVVRYEYKCAWCRTINIRYDETRRVVCDKCKKAFHPC